jgi:sugar phosphate isomerase/epimerase
MTAAPPAPGIALQLYTLRSLTAVDLLGTIREVAALGYEGVELAGLQGLDPGAVASVCDEVGLTIAGAHVGAEAFAASPGTVAAELRALGLDAIVFPTLPLGEGLAAVERLHALALQARALGLEPIFHNHATELRRDASGFRPWEALLALDEIAFELDLGWAWVAGESPADLLDRLSGRVPLVHVKDHLRDASGTPDCPVGDGEVGYDVVVPLAAARGARWLIVEQDEPGDDPLGAAERSLAAVRSFRGGVA